MTKPTLISDERLKEIRELEAEATEGPWQWFGNTKAHEIYLATVHGGRRIVMDFVRWGMQRAQPRFQPRDKGYMIDSADLVNYEKDYRKDFIGINNADAEFIAQSRTIIRELLNHIAALSAVATEIKEGR